LWLALEPRRLVQQGLVACVLGWTALAGVDNWRYLNRYITGQVPDPMREIVAALEARGVSIVEAPYWRAYKLSFLTQERITSASTDVIRITEYQERAASAGSLIRLQESPCPGGQQVAGWYLCEPSR